MKFFSTINFREGEVGSKPPKIILKIKQDKFWEQQLSVFRVWVGGLIFFCNELN